jgi:hypothetical protein
MIGNFESNQEFLEAIKVPFVVFSISLSYFVSKWGIVRYNF